MQKKYFALIAIILLISCAGIFFWTKYHSVPGYSDQDYSDQEDYNQEETANTRQREVFTGDNGVLLKGKLLNNQFKSDYEALPDTLANLQFGDEFYQEEAGYSIFPEKLTAANIDKEANSVNHKFTTLLQYLKLAEEGKATYPQFAFPAGPSPGGMMEISSFRSKYDTHFSSFYLAEIPYQIKEVILDFFNTDEGKDFTFITNDQRDHSALIRKGSFTGKDKKELACVVGTKDDVQNDHQEKLLVFAHNREGRTYIIFKENFYDKILLETVYPDPEERWDDRVYQGAEEKKEMPFDGIRIKQAGQPDVVLVYNEEFDKMNRYVQIPASQIAKDEREE